MISNWEAYGYALRAYQRGLYYYRDLDARGAFVIDARRIK
jgi:hypothetical protein